MAVKDTGSKLLGTVPPAGTVVVVGAGAVVVGLVVVAEPVASAPVVVAVLLAA